MNDHPAPPPLPASLLADVPAPALVPYAFGALLLRVGDDGTIAADIACGYNHGHSREAAESEFVAQVRITYPGCSITKVLGSEVQPPASAAGEASPPESA